MPLDLKPERIITGLFGSANPALCITICKSSKLWSEHTRLNVRKYWVLKLFLYRRIRQLASDGKGSIVIKCRVSNAEVMENFTDLIK
ncbi:hypothetical protein D3C76_1644940 [compost metagenome]